MVGGGLLFSCVANCRFQFHRARLKPRSKMQIAPKKTEAAERARPGGNLCGLSISPLRCAADFEPLKHQFLVPS